MDSIFDLLSLCQYSLYSKESKNAIAQDDDLMTFLCLSYSHLIATNTSKFSTSNTLTSSISLNGS